MHLDFLNKEDLSILCRIRHSPVKTVYFYHDEKIYREENDRFIQMMHQFGLEWKVKKLQHWQVEPLKWGEDSLFVIPGGHTTDIHERLSPKIEEIKQYAQQGGSLFFQCGGSYWAGEREYRFNAENVVNKNSELNLWKAEL